MAKSTPLLSELREPPVVGQFYLVPVIKAFPYFGIVSDWPVIGPKHQLSSWRVWLPGLLGEIAAYRAQAINRGWNWRMCDAYGREEYERQMASEIDRTHEITMGRMTLAESYRDPSPITPASQARGGAPAVIRNPPAGAHSSSEVSQ